MDFLSVCEGYQIYPVEMEAARKTSDSDDHEIWKQFADKGEPVHLDARNQKVFYWYVKLFNGLSFDVGGVFAALWNDSEIEIDIESDKDYYWSAWSLIYNTTRIITDIKQRLASRQYERQNR